jgi:His-Xaa-Ser system protein HxsD
MRCGGVLHIYADRSFLGTWGKGMSGGVSFRISTPGGAERQTTIQVAIDTRIVPTAAVTKALYWIGDRLRLDASRQSVDPHLITLTGVIAVEQTNEICSLVECTLIDFAIRDRIEQETRDLRNQIVHAALDLLHAAR